jgi:hypothetical protein
LPPAQLSARAPEDAPQQSAEARKGQQLREDEQADLVPRLPRSAPLTSSIGLLPAAGAFNSAGLEASRISFLFPPCQQ